MIAAKGGFPEEEKPQDDGESKGAPSAAQSEVDKSDMKPEEGAGEITDPALQEFVESSPFFICKSNSEDIANITHLALTVSLLDLQPPNRSK